MCLNKAKMIKRFFFHCFVPLLVGFIIYLLCYKPALVLHYWFSAFIALPNFYAAVKKYPVLMFLLNHIPDILWNYSLTCFLLLFISNSLPPFRKAAIIVFTVSLTEIIQVFFSKQFTFDWIDLSLAVITPLLIIKFYKNEKATII
jgi:hypothetical protein